jgi:predicted DNA-binding transcriptional regulator AlpA
METMTTKEVCEFLGISRATLYNRIEAGKLKPIPSNSVLEKAPLKFDRAAIEAYKEAAERAAATK